VENIGVVGAAIGAGTTELMATYQQEVEQLKGAVAV
jgi:hypothetical protein